MNWLRLFGWKQSVVLWVESLWRDFGYAVRMLLKTPGFSAVALLTLALGIGVNLNLFSLLNEQLLRPQKVRRPDELWAILPSDASGEPKWFNTSRFYYEAIRKDRRAFNGIIGCSNFGTKMKSSEGWQEIRAHLVSGEFFSFLGIQPILGRGFLPEEDDKPGIHSVAVISYRLWQEYFRGDTNVLGKTVTLDNQIVEVVGVAPRGFKGISLYQPDLWLPISMERLFDSSQVYYIVGRLKTGISPTQAADALAPLVRDTTKNLLAGGDPLYTNNISHFTRVALLREGYGSLPAEWAWEGHKDLTKAATLVGVATFLVLLITAFNLANLLLARALRRRKEMATRLALGATRWTLIRQLMLEGVILASLGASAAIALLFWLGNAATQMMPGVVYARADINLRPDVRVAAFALLSAIAVGAGFSFLPAFQVSRLDPFATLKDPDGGSGLHRRHLSLRAWLMIMQVAVSLILLSGTGLCLGAITRQLRIDVGFPAQSIAAAAVDLEQVGFTAEAAQPLVEELRQRFSQLPGVEAVGIIDMLPLMGQRGHLVTDRLEGYTMPEGGNAEFGYRIIGPDCFRALGISVLDGRDISEADWSTHRRVAMVNECFARTFWRNQTVLGKRIERLHEFYEIVGVVRDARFDTLAQAPEPTMFFAADNRQMLHPNFIIRTAKDPRFILRPILAELERIHPGLRKSHVLPLHQFMINQLRPQREAMNLLGRLGALALGLTVLGVYGMMSYLVRQRTREVGIRIAVGAQRADIAKLVLRFGAWLALAGVTVGLPVAFCGSLLLRHAVFGVRPFDPQSFLLAAGAVLFAVLSACAIPALRATRIDPMLALRHE